MIGNRRKVRWCTVAFALTLYGLAGALVWWWAALVLLPLRPAVGGEPDAAAIGMVRAGARGALLATVVELCAAQTLQVTARGGLSRGAQPLSADATPLARAVYEVLVTRRTWRALRLRAPVRHALHLLATDLAARGLVPGQRRWRTARVIQAVVTLLALLAVSRAGALPGWLLLPAVLLIAAAAAAWGVPRRTVAGWRLLARCRRELAARGDTVVDSAAPTGAAPEHAAYINAVTGVVPDGVAPAVGRSAPGAPQ